MRLVYKILVWLSSILTVYFVVLVLLADTPSAGAYFAAGTAALSVFLFYQAARMAREKEEAAQKIASENRNLFP